MTEREVLNNFFIFKYKTNIEIHFKLFFKFFNFVNSQNTSINPLNCENRIYIL